MNIPTFSPRLCVYCVLLHIYFFINLDNVRMISWCVRWYQAQNSAESKTFMSQKTENWWDNPRWDKYLTKQLSTWLTSDTSSWAPCCSRGYWWCVPWCHLVSGDQSEASVSSDQPIRGLCVLWLCGDQLWSAASPRPGPGWPQWVSPRSPASDVTWPVAANQRPVMCVSDQSEASITMWCCHLHDLDKCVPVLWPHAPGLSQAALSWPAPPWRRLSAVGGAQTSFETPAPGNNTQCGVSSSPVSSITSWMHWWE